MFYIVGSPAVHCYFAIAKTVADHRLTGEQKAGLYQGLRYILALEMHQAELKFCTV